MAETPETTRTKFKLYCEPTIKQFLTVSWLHMSFWDGILFLPQILTQLGMAGNVTAYGDTSILENFSFDDLNASNKNDEFSIFFVTSPKKVTTLRFFRNGDENESKCIIPGYDGEYTSNFAVVEEKENRKKYFFYDVCDLDWGVYPRFSKEFHSNGILCMETTEAEYIRVTFMVKRFPDCTIFFTTVIKNDDNSKLVIEAYTDNILKVLNTEKAKSIFTQYEKIRKFIGHITNDYVITCKSKDGKTTDELVVVDGATEKFMITNAEKQIILYKSHNWDMHYKKIKIKCRDNKFSFPNTVFTASELKHLEEVVNNANNFISENMAFAFEGQF